MANILVTGGCGFIGANLVPLLRAAGHQVRIVDNLSRGRIEFLDDPSAYEVIQGDIRDQAAMTAAASGMDAIIHLAAYGSVVESVADPVENFSINAEGTFRVLCAAREAGVEQIIFSSTGGALIGNATPPVSETSAPRPISPYGASKLAGEGYCCAFAHSYDLSITALRFANVVGPISWHKKGAVTAFFKAILNDQPMRIYGDGTATRDFLYVGDLCQGILAALGAKLPVFNVFHLASGREVSVKELAELARAAAGLDDYPIEYEPKRKGEVDRNFANFDLANRVLDFRPETPLIDALRLTYDWFLTQRHSA
jgi:UDP-glucose 4-epimerase